MQLAAERQRCLTLFTPQPPVPFSVAKAILDPGILRVQNFTEIYYLVTNIKWLRTYTYSWLKPPLNVILPSYDGHPDKRYVPIPTP